MPPSRIYHTFTRLPILSTLLLGFANFEVYRIYHGTHPYLMIGMTVDGQQRSLKSVVAERRAEELRAKKQRTEGHKARADGTEADRTVSPGHSGPPAPFGDRVSAETTGKSGDGGERWIYIDGIPIPSFGLLMRPWRRD